MTVFNITVYLDTVCPWCYIGHRTLEKAIDLYRKTYPGGGSDEFNYTWLPYYLVPNAPVPGIPMLRQIADKNGPERVNAITARLDRIGRAHGIEFDFGAKTGRTRDSHRLIAYAGSRGGAGLQTKIVEELFASHFERAGDITSVEMLVDVGVAVGLSRDEVRGFLDGDDGAAEVDAGAARARLDGVSSVPTVVINGVTVEGAEDASTFYQAFVSAKEGAAQTGAGTQ